MKARKIVVLALYVFIALTAISSNLFPKHMSGWWVSACIAASAVAGTVIFLRVPAPPPPVQIVNELISHSRDVQHGSCIMEDGGPVSISISPVDVCSSQLVFSPTNNIGGEILNSNTLRFEWEGQEFPPSAVQIRWSVIESA